MTPYHLEYHEIEKSINELQDRQIELYRQAVACLQRGGFLVVEDQDTIDQLGGGIVEETVSIEISFTYRGLKNFSKKWKRLRVSQ